MPAKKKSDKKLVWITGISGSVGDEYLEKKFLPYAEKQGKKVKIFYPGKMLFEIPGTPLDHDNVLNAPRDILETRMEVVFQKILGGLDDCFKKYDAVIVKTHKWFRWERSYVRAHGAYSVMQFHSDMFVTFIDGITQILGRLKRRKQFQYQDFTKEEICDWQDVEVESTAELAEITKKQFFVIPSGESGEVLYHLIFDAVAEPAYVAVDMTHSNKELRDKIDDFVTKTKKYLPCLINPYTLPLDYENRTKAEDSHIVNASLNWFVRQAKIFIPYYPAVLTSHGKAHETGKAYLLTKDVWVVYLPGKGGPFEEHLKTHPIFRTEKEFFNFLKNRKK